LAGVLLDTHTLYWLASGTKTLSPYAIEAVLESQETSTLYISPINVWELSLATRKIHNAPQFGGLDVQVWFRRAAKALTARVLPINLKIALEAAAVVTATGHKDPGDCYLIATARVKQLKLVSRDEIILGLAASGYLRAIDC
jgi:PIN domain nuclease of toxin-antitoxin system